MFSFNPFELDITIGSNPPIKSITVASNIDWFSVPATALTGSSIVLPVNVRSDIAALKVFATGVAIGAPSMISLQAAHIPNIAISQVTGLQAAINSILKSLVSANSLLSVSNNGSGDYTLTVNSGTTGSTVAIGNDTRFPASVTGLRKGAGAGSLDVAAVARTDYWDTSDFVASGASHRHGLVPDPGASAGATKFLREDATWVVPSGSGTVTSIATTSPITGGTITTTGTIGLNVAVDHLFTAAQTITLTNSSTVSDDIPLTLIHNSSGTPLAGFGTALEFLAKSGTVISREQGNVFTAWSVATDATRSSYMGFRVVSSAVTSERMRLWGSGGLAVNDLTGTDPGAGIVKAANFQSTGLTGTIIKTNGSGLHIAATAKADYWDTTDFVGIGPSNAHGLVPTPGNPGGAPQRYLREDATWQNFIPANGSLTLPMLATQAATTLLANATGSTASPTAVDAKTARSSSLLNLESITTFGNANYPALATDKYIATSANFTAARTVTLPLANTFNPAQSITISDDFGAINGVNTLVVARSGADTIQGMTSSVVLDSKYASITLSSDGVGKWSIISRNPPVNVFVITSNTTYNPPTGVKSIFVEGVGAGGGGAGAQASSSNCAAGAGGGGGTYAAVYVKSPASSYAVVIGNPGAGGATGNGSGGVGGDTTFGSILTAKGGLGGTCTGGGTTIAVNGVAGDSVTPLCVGDSISAGNPGINSFRLSGTVGIAGNGGGSRFAGGALAPTTQTGGNIGGNPGGGGSGALSTSATGFLGGAGNQGIIRIWEFF